MQGMWRKGWGIGLVILLTGCVSVGKEVTQAQVEEFKKGETTADQVVARLGPPNSSTKTLDGKTVLTYGFVHSQARPASFIPYVGLLAGGADSRSSTVVFVFDANGKLADATSTQSQFGSGVGFAAGSYQTAPASAPQPQEVKQ